jgi:hypothetical protein
VGLSPEALQMTNIRDHEPSDVFNFICKALRDGVPDRFVLGLMLDPRHKISEWTEANGFDLLNSIYQQAVKDVALYRSVMFADRLAKAGEIPRKSIDWIIPGALASGKVTGLAARGKVGQVHLYVWFGRPRRRRAGFLA